MMIREGSATWERSDPGEAAGWHACLPQTAEWVSRGVVRVLWERVANANSPQPWATLRVSEETGGM